MPARFLLRTLLAFSSLLAPGLTHGETASETTTLALLEQLQESDLPDVMLWVIERAAPESSPDTRRRLDFLKGSALVSQSRVAADTEARTELLDEAERSIDAFLASSPADDMAIAAFTQKGSLLVERGRICLALAAAARRRCTVARSPRRRPRSSTGRSRRSARPHPRRPAAARDPRSHRRPSFPRRSRPPKTRCSARCATWPPEIERIRLPAKDDPRRVRRPRPRRLAPLPEGGREVRRRDPPEAGRRCPGSRRQIGDVAAAAARPRHRRRRKPPGAPARGPRQLGGRLAGHSGTEIAMPSRPPSRSRRPSSGRSPTRRAKLSKQLAAAEKPLEKELEEPLRRQEELRTKLLQTRLMVAEICFEKSKAYATGSREWKAALEESQRLNHDLVEKYGKLGVGFVARLNEAAARRSSASGMPRSPRWRRCSRSSRRPASPCRHSASH
jgi:uncharacterized protein (DUF4415 family)